MITTGTLITMSRLRRCMSLVLLIGVLFVWKDCLATNNDSIAIKRSSFPKGFVFGTASSAYQVCFCILPFFFLLYFLPTFHTFFWSFAFFIGFRAFWSLCIKGLDIYWINCVNRLAVLHYFSLFVWCDSCFPELDILCKNLQIHSFFYY